MIKSYRLAMLAVLIIAALAGFVQARLERERAMADLRTKLQGLSLSVQEVVSANLSMGRNQRLARVLKQFSNHEQMASVVVCSAGRTVAVDSTGGIWAPICSDPIIFKAEQQMTPQSKINRADNQQYMIFSRRVQTDDHLNAPHSVVLVHSLADVDGRVQGAFLRAGLTALVAGTLAYVFLMTLMGFILRRSALYLVRWIRSLFRIDSAKAATRLREVNQHLPQEFRELTKELSTLALKMRQDRMRLVWNAQAAQNGEPVIEDRWAALRSKVNEVLRGRRLIIVANREPYSHERRDGSIQVVRPASGVVTALEPIMRLCGGGIWVGHGSGSADREVVDANDEVKVPPENPTYTLRRVWLTKEEEDGYYYGFANEGMWPLCHLAYTRPTFRLPDWEMYKKVNERFAETTLRNVDPSNAVILVQDYHYALLPKMIRDRAPQATIELFWHIPWPNPEAFGICPQYKDLLEGMLGADVVGFHTQYHCNNFLETCDRYLECRVDWERFSVTVNDRETLVRSYPISIATEPVTPLTIDRRAELKLRYGIHSEHVALGVDRLDYTKGLLERFSGVERFLEKYPEFVGKFTFVEMGTPSRTNIISYRTLIEEVEGAVERVNKRFGNDGYKPIVLLKGHYDWNEVADFYQLGDVCLVTSLHDGMNLVAKEYVWSQAPENGALVLSRFTGAARELSEAIIVNPYSIEEIADAIYQGLTWTPEEKRVRMMRMKEKVQNHNAFHWATDLLAGVNAKA